MERLSAELIDANFLMSSINWLIVHFDELKMSGEPSIPRDGLQVQW